MSLRQIQDTFRIIGHTLAASEPAKRGKMDWCIGAGVILMSALKVAGHGMYHQIGKDEATHQEVGKFLIKLVGKQKAQWWFSIYFTGSSRQEGRDATSVEKLFKELGLIENDALPNWQDGLGQFGHGWGYHSNERWKQIYRNIETANTF